MTTGDGETFPEGFGKSFVELHELPGSFQSDGVSEGKEFRGIGCG